MAPDPRATQEEVIYLERLARRCKAHGYAEQAGRLRAKADRLNGQLRSEDRVSADDPRSSVPIETPTVTEFIALCTAALDDVREDEGTVIYEFGVPVPRIIETAAARKASNVRIHRDGMFVVSMEKGATLFDLIGLEQDLSELLEQEIHVWTDDVLQVPPGARAVGRMNFRSGRVSEDPVVVVDTSWSYLHHCWVTLAYSPDIDVTSIAPIHSASWIKALRTHEDVIDELQTLLALDEAHAELERGEGRPLEEVLPELRRRIGAVLYDGETGPFDPRDDIRAEIERIRARLADPANEFTDDARLQLERAVEQRERWIRDAQVRSFRTSDGETWVAFEHEGGLAFRRQRTPDFIVPLPRPLAVLEDDHLRQALADAADQREIAQSSKKGSH